jgi:hypothetical protein
VGWAGSIRALLGGFGGQKIDETCRAGLTDMITAFSLFLAEGCLGETPAMLA